MSDSTQTEKHSSSNTAMTNAQKARIERNRVKAQNLRRAKHPDKNAANAVDDTTSIIKVQGTKYVDSGGGFLLEQTVLAETGGKPCVLAPAPAIDDGMAKPMIFEECIECGDQFADSFLFSNFGHSVCDKCHDSEDRHLLITRTEAKSEYLLKDCDFDKREPQLRYISRANPHNVRWGEMKLYLHLQVVQRSMEVWGSEEELMRQHELRGEKREIGKMRKYNKEMKQLRMEVRSSIYTKKTVEVHRHELGLETYNEAEDNYTRACLTCPYIETFEKM